MKRTPNLAALVAGIVLMAVGFAVVLDDAERINLEFAYAGPSILAALGAILLVSGLASRRRGRG
jgi:divalent metal cation (Fe/Co/Zn/Cd) transporter